MGDQKKGISSGESSDIFPKGLSTGIASCGFDDNPVQHRYSIRPVLAGVLAIVAVGAILAGIFFSGDKAETVVPDAVSEPADLEVKDFRYAQVGNLDFQWEVRADRAWYRKKDDKVHLETVTVKLVSTGGRTYRMTGKEGLLNNDTGDMVVSGQVRIDGQNGNRLETETLRYRSSDKQAFTDEEVVMKNNSMVVSGKGMTFAFEGNDLVLLSDVKAVVTDALFQ